MEKKSGNKLNTTGFAIVAVAGLVVATLLVFVASTRQGQPALATIQEPAAENDEGLAFQVTEPESFVQQTGKSAIVTQADPDLLSLMRGDSSNVIVTASHIGGANADEYVSVKVSAPIGYTLYPPSVAASSTPEERYQAAKAETTLPGGIDLARFMTIVGPAEKTVAKSAQQTFDVVITVPSDLPDELVGQEIYIPINISATDGSGNDIPGAGTGVMVVVSQ